MRYGPALALSAALLIPACFPASDPPQYAARLAGELVWTHDADWFGGLSALSVRDNGTRVVAITDSARLIEARLTRQGGTLSGVTLDTSRALLNTSGWPIKGDYADAEGLAIAPDGTMFVSFENKHRVLRYANGPIAERLPAHQNFDLFRLNGSLEALAIAEDGTLFTLPERPLSGRSGFPVYAFDGVAWRRAFSLPPRNGFLAVGADFGPDGAFYLLERRITPLGFQSRVRRWHIGADGPTDETVILRSRPGLHGNLEGLSVWRDTAGHLRLTLVADDNFWRMLQTEIVEYVITE
ncbi:esterase-like activity of phytase family protein [Thalassococcus sp. S3]|uniref:esterase-like activity of phytase family protein n=1 Tax=Thalassococcus sp. S3 TaxID=2017482 RepID=UPI0010244559|nr:esterase-like activity of phytase family protein [Thalassococcus sp. S3]QBF29815.1 hypothetical protein CFI11_01100 [Thalassococcus sp. S3]